MQTTTKSNRSYQDPLLRIDRTVGETSQILFEAINEHQNTDHQALRRMSEAAALAKAFEQAKPGDTIVHTVGNDHARSAALAKLYLQNT